MSPNHTRRNFLAAGAGASMPLLAGCQETRRSIFGNGTGTGTSSLTGQVVYPDGSKARNVDARLYDRPEEETDTNWGASVARDEASPTFDIDGGGTGDRERLLVLRDRGVVERGPDRIQSGGDWFRALAADPSVADLGEVVLNRELLYGPQLVDDDAGSGPVGLGAVTMWREVGQQRENAFFIEVASTVPRNLDVVEPWKTNGRPNLRNGMFSLGVPEQEIYVDYGNGEVLGDRKVERHEGRTSDKLLQQWHPLRSNVPAFEVTTPFEEFYSEYETDTSDIEEDVLASFEFILGLASLASGPVGGAATAASLALGFLGTIVELNDGETIPFRRSVGTEVTVPGNLNEEDVVCTGWRKATSSMVYEIPVGFNVDRNVDVAGRAVWETINNGRVKFKHGFSRGPGMTSGPGRTNPDPEFVSLSVPNRATAGEPLALSVEARNAGTRGGNWSSISVSFPALDGAGDTDRVSVTSTDLPWSGTAGPGDTLTGSDGGEVEADYVLAEASTGGDGTWESDATHSLDLEVTPRSDGTFPVYVRTTLTRPDASATVTEPPTSEADARDQQGFPVRRFDVEVTRSATAEGLVAHWPLDEVSNGRVRDASGNGHHGSVAGDPREVAGVVGGALAFDGDDHVKVGMTERLQTTGSFTLAMWLRTDPAVDSWVVPFGMYTYDGNGTGQGLSLRTDRNSVDFHARHSDGFGSGGPPEEDPYYHTGGGVAVSAGEWHHAAVRYDDAGDGIALFVDGAERYAMAAPEDPRTDDTYLLLGARPAPDGGGHPDETGISHFRGALDDVRVYRRALSAAELRSLGRR